MSLHLPQSLYLRLAAGRTAWRIVAGLIAVYALAFAIFYPRTVTVVDEMSYVRQAQLLGTGGDRESVRHPLTGQMIDVEIRAVYPLGTALTLAPWICLGGWRMGFIAPALCLLLAVIVTGRWLAAAGHSPIWAGVLLGYPPALVLGRVCMSETPSLLWVSLGLLCFWRGIDGARALLWLAAGFVAGASLLFREGNVLLFAPLFAGAMLRRDRAWWILLVGGLAGVGTRLASSQLFWGDPFYYKKLPGFAFGLDSIVENLPLYGLALLVFVPGGLVAALLYRGPRRPEIVGTVVLFVVFYLLYDYSGESSGFAKQLILGPRFFVPLLPVLAFALADALPRLWESIGDLWPDHRSQFEVLASAAVVTWVVGLGVASIGANAVHASWSSSQAAIRDAIYEHTPEDAIIVSNARALSKTINSIYGRRVHLDRDAVSTRMAAAMVRRNGVFYLVLLNRTDSEHWRRDARRNAVYLSSFYPRPELRLDLTVTPTDRLRIWEVREIKGGL